MKCPKCGLQVEDRAKFCMECGTKLQQTDDAGTEKVFTLEQWKEQKNREKDAKVKQARQQESERLKAIEQKMYDKQDEFEPLARKKKKAQEP